MVAQNISMMIWICDIFYRHVYTHAHTLSSGFVHSTEQYVSLKFRGIPFILPSGSPIHEWQTQLLME